MDVSNLQSQISDLKILIRLPNWLGDVVMSTAFIAAVRQVYPGAAIDVIIKKELAGIAGFIPGLNNIHRFSKLWYPGLAGAYRFGKKFNGGQYDLYFNLPHSLSANVMAWASGAGERVGFRKEAAFLLLNHSYKKPRYLHRADEYLHLLEQFTGRQITGRQVVLDVAKINADDRQTVIINFNSEASSRRMPLDKGRSILNNLTKNFKDITFTLIGSPKESGFIQELLTDLNDPGQFINYAGKTDLPGLVRLLAGAKALLTTDSGPAHLANSVGTPVVVLFGAGNELNTAPYNKKDLTVLRYGQLSCEPCLKNTCLLYGIPKCMQMLEELKIMNALSLYLYHA